MREGNPCVPQEFCAIPSHYHRNNKMPLEELRYALKFSTWEFRLPGKAIPVSRDEVRLMNADRVEPGWPSWPWRSEALP
jgi:hypothetical protein